jgi:hypothetical protein
MIELKPNTKPISKTPYMMMDPKLCELKIQLKELLELGIIRPSVSSWGAVNIFQGGWFLTIVYILKGFELGHNEGDLNLCMNATK